MAEKDTEKKEEEETTFKEEAIDFAKFAVGFVTAFFLVRSLVYDYFIIPSSSMYPTLLIGDMPLVEKWPYGYSKHSFWFSPNVFDGRKAKQRDVVRGEVIVFKMPKDGETNIIKRVVGLPGDTIKVVNGTLYINGLEAKRTFVDNIVYVDERNGAYNALKLYREVIPYSNIEHDVAYDPERAFTPQNHMPEITVPAGHYFVMGDNRDNSMDSRSGLGLIPEENLMGHASHVLHSIGNGVKLWEPHLWLQNIRYSRILKKII